MKRLMIIDALNQFLRAYIVNPTLSPNGDPVGGAIGFLKILQKLCREIKPDNIIICWDGSGGSKKRKLINKNYKEGRKPLRLNRDIKVLTEEEELQNKIWQQLKTVDYLNQFPVIQLMYDDIEADDIVSFVCQLPDYKNWQKVIVSSDKDFFQLLDDNTVILRPTQNEVLNKHAIVEKFGIHPTNFALARAIVGDQSDNLAGVRGVGLSSVAKRLSFLSKEQAYTIDDVKIFCENINSNLKVYKNILNDIELICVNYKLMQLYSPNISIQTKNNIKYIIRNMKYMLNKTEVHCMMLEDGVGNFNWDDLFLIFKKIVRENKNMPS